MLKRLLRYGLLFAALAAAAPSHAQTALQQGGAWTLGHVPTYSRSGSTGTPLVIDSGPAGGNTTGQGLSELNVTARGTGAAPYAGQGSGPNGEIFCLQDATSNTTAGYHSLCLSANAAGGGLISYQAGGAAAQLPLNFLINGTTYAFPFAVGGIVGPPVTVVNDAVCWNNLTGTLVKTCPGATPLVIGGSNGQIQYNNAGALGGFTASGDATIVGATGVVTVSKIGGVAISLGGALTTADAFTTVGAFPITLTAVGSTTLTLPQSGTLATLAGSEAFTNKTYNGLTITSTTGTLAIANGKTLTASNTLTLAGTDGSTLNIGTGGTLGSAAFTASTAYAPATAPITDSLTSAVALSNIALYFTGPTVAQGSTGTWCASGTVTLIDGGGAANFFVKLWDGTTVIAATQAGSGSGQTVAASLSGCLANPAGNIRISVRDTSTTSGGIIANNTSNGNKDSTLTVWRVQ